MRAGFSLIELLAVLTLISLFVVSISIRWSGPYNEIKFKSDIERLVDFDFKARRHATSRNRECRLIVEFESNIVHASRWQNGKEQLLPLVLGGGTSIAQLLISNGRATSGIPQLGIGPDGSTKTYAILLQQGGKQRWIVFAGRTGQPLITSDKEDVETIFKEMLAQGTDAN